MNINFELIIPPLILGILITMITSANTVMMDSAVENQSTYHLQTNANNAVMLVQEQVKHLHRVKNANGSVLEFVEKTSSTADSIDVRVFRDGDYLKILRTPRGGSTTSEDYFLRLESLSFKETVHGTTSAPFLQVTVITTSSTSGQPDDTKRYKASSERSIYLKNLHTSDIFSTGS